MAPKAWNFDYIKSRKIYYMVSGGLFAIALICMLIFGVRIDIQFRGGTMASYSYSGEVSEQAFKQAVEAQTGQHISIAGAQNIQTGEENFNIEFAGSEGIPVEEQAALLQKLQETFPDNNIQSVSVNSVSPTMGKDFLLKCLVAVFFAALFMVVYIALRFKRIGGWSAGVFSVLALIHDVLMVFATFIIFRMPLDDNFMAVVLVILGYSVNDTIVIFDRIRENEKLYGKTKPLFELVNDSINQTLGRTIHTTVSTLMAMAVVCIMAFINQVDSIVTFSFPLIIGLLSGSYSSICICSPSWAAWRERGKKTQPPKQEAEAQA